MILQPMESLIQAMLLAVVEEAGLNPGVGNELIIRPFKNNHTVTRLTVLTDLEWADHDGAAGIACGEGDPQKFKNPVTGETEIRLREPVDGFQWAVAGSSNLPQTIHGYALLSEDSAVLYAAVNREPVTLTTPAQFHECTQPVFPFPVNLIS